MAIFSDGPFSRNTEVPPIELMIAVTMDVVVVAFGYVGMTVRGLLNN